MGARTRTEALEEIPWAELQEIAKAHDKAFMRVQRRNARGQLQTLSSSVTLETSQFSTIEDWLQAFAGGGSYEIELRSVISNELLVSRFKVPLEGAVRPPRFLGNPEDNMQYVVNPYGQQQQQENVVSPPFQAPSGPWANGIHPEQQTTYPRSAPMRAQAPAPGATVASDQLAIRQFAEYKAETAKSMAKLEAQVERLLDDNRRKDEALAAERERAREERHRSEMQLIREQLKMMGETPKVEAKGTADMIAALAPFAPVFAAMVTSRESSSSKSLEVQQQGLATLMNATLSQANKPDGTSELLKTFLPLALPFIKDIMEQKGPQAQAQLFNSMVENNLSQVAMMAQLIEAFASQGDSEPWWLPMIKETLGGVVGMTEAYMQSKGGLPGQQANMLPANTPRPSAPPMLAGATYNADTPAEVVDTSPPPNPARAKARAERATQQVATGTKPGNGIEDTLTTTERMMLNMVPNTFQTHEWRAIIIALNREKDIDEVAELVAGHIVHLINFNMLPKEIEDVIEDPARALDRLLAPMPIMQRNADYGIAVMQAVIELLVEYEAVVSPTSLVEDDDDEEDAEEETYGDEATPAAPAGAA